MSNQLNKIPCRRCGELQSGRFHSSVFPHFQYLYKEFEEANRMAEYEKAQYFNKLVQEMMQYIYRNYPEHMGRDCYTIGMVSAFEPISNLEYLEWKAWEKEKNESL